MEKGAECYVRLAATRLLPVLNSFRIRVWLAIRFRRFFSPTCPSSIGRIFIRSYRSSFHIICSTRLSPSGLWSIALIYRSLVLKLQFRSIVLVSRLSYAPPAPTAAVRCAFRFICTYGCSMLRSVVMSFCCLQSSCRDSTRDVRPQLGGRDVLNWAEEASSIYVVGRRRISRTFSEIEISSQIAVFVFVI
jgi:hypothetical protein